MKISEIIRERRLQKGLTQEQVASCLGVSTPAVNKWEHGTTYPDITLLPPLARLLGTDLNTLLSFQADLTEREIFRFVEEVGQAAKEDLDAACNLALEKARTYPDCDALLLNLAMTLDGVVILYAGEAADRCKEVAEDFYTRASRSGDADLGNRAKSMLISRFIARKDYERAEALLEALPDQEANNKKQLKTRLFIEQGKLKEAAELMGNKVLAEANLLQMDLLTLIEIAWKEGRAQDAEDLAGLASQVMASFGFWAYCVELPRFQLALHKQDAHGCMDALRKLLSAAQEGWNPAASPLYRHFPQKPEGSANTGLAAITPRLLEELERTDRPDYAFLRASPEFEGFLSELRARYGKADAT